MISRNKNGKALISLPQSAKILTPQLIEYIDTDACLAITTEGANVSFSCEKLTCIE